MPHPLFHIIHTPTHSPSSPIPLALVHGWTCTHRLMTPFVDAFHDWHSINVDLLGHGQSPTSLDYSINAQARALLATIPHHAIIIGHSMGALVALEAATLDPNRIKAIVLLDPAPIVLHDNANAFLHKIKTDIHTTSNLKDLLETFGRTQIITPSSHVAVDEMATLMRNNDPHIVRACWDAICTFDGHTKLAHLQTPCLIITVPRSINRLSDLTRCNRSIHTAQVALSGHMVQLEVMDQLSPMIRRFFSHCLPSLQ